MLGKQLVARPTPPHGPTTAAGQLRPAASNCRLSRNKCKGGSDATFKTKDENHDDRFGIGAPGRMVSQSSAGPGSAFLFSRTTGPAGFSDRAVSRPASGAGPCRRNFFRQI